MTKERKFRQLTPLLIKWEEEGQTIEGTLKGKGSIEFEENTVGQYSIEADNGVLYGVLGGKIIDEAMKDVEVGAYIRIIFLKEDKTRAGQPIRLFDVLIAEDD